MVTGLDRFFQALLMVGFATASLRLLWTVRHLGRRTIRIFRSVGAIVTFLWAAFYGHAVFGSESIFRLADVARFLQYFNLLMFLTWGFLYTEDRWLEEAKRKLAELNGDE